MMEYSNGIPVVEGIPLDLWILGPIGGYPEKKKNKVERKERRNKQRNKEFVFHGTQAKAGSKKSTRKE